MESDTLVWSPAVCSNNMLSRSFWYTLQFEHCCSGDQDFMYYTNTLGGKSNNALSRHLMSYRAAVSLSRLQLKAKQISLASCIYSNKSRKHSPLWALPTTNGLTSVLLTGPKSKDEYLNSTCFCQCREDLYPFSVIYEFKNQSVTSWGFHREQAI